MDALVAAPAFLSTWALLLTIWLAPATWLISSAVGRQALVDERVRQIEVLGGAVDDAEYAALQQSPPWLTYFVSGGRVLLAPPVTVLAACGLVALARLDRGAISLRAALAVSVHASTVLVLQELAATPLHYWTESIASPVTLASVLPGGGEGTWLARFLGVIGVFGLWWVGLLAVGVAAATKRPPRRYLIRLLAVYFGIAALIAAAIAVLGGS
jgi:hypothetical protein